ncbi:NAD(P)/FAD-dependent oxidoreductase [Spirosoma taeanense]|uniref:NAD(P)/FAD-dependent oxidoreductase n=1 Tax=Spirosoma taeanense TaxID=2735870 RepID=A0A6M5Y8V1_9BACT|nr:NAD(P)/FAD-dependent oxidoreductase [Spirosoma taeanense]QJW89192.1 NAD(P)/FAD-dependent oxidoreductase [Spirosoma taeanense]
MKPDVDVAIIGAGFAGLGAAVRLKQRSNTSFVVFERADRVGGTWRDNIYPGCACDVPSHLYSLSFAPNPNWSRMYSPQPEILAYLQNVVDTYNLQPHIRYHTEIIRTEFSEENACWTVTDRTGNALTARVVIGAIGPLNRPTIPKLPGLDQFAGRTFHSSRWDTSYDLTGKRVAVVGTGASAIQIVPAIAPIVGQLTVFQRTAPYVMPRLDRAVSSVEQRLFRQLPVFQKSYRTFIYWLNELRGLSFLGNETFHKFGTAQARKHLEASIDDPELRRKATPNYKMGCKRVLVSDDYYPALTRPNVELVTERIAEVKPNAVVTSDGTERPIDVLIFGTGFVASEIICDLNIIGRNGRSLFDEWLTTGPEAHYGLTTSGYPNLLFLVGPNTGLGHNSIVHMIESQVNYVLGYLDLLERAGHDAFLDVKPEVQAAYNADIQQKLARTVWASGCQSWYLDARGRNTTLWPALTVAYRNATRRVNPADYNIVQARQLAANRA